MHEDWSKVRSPSRAARRLKSGKRKHAIPKIGKPAIYQLGDKIVIHPEIVKAMRERIAAQIPIGAT